MHRTRSLGIQSRKDAYSVQSSRWPPGTLRAHPEFEDWVSVRAGFAAGARGLVHARAPFVDVQQRILLPIQDQAVVSLDKRPTARGTKVVTVRLLHTQNQHAFAGQAQLLQRVPG